MLLVLDSNEYIFAFGPQREPFSAKLLEAILANPSKLEIRICRTTVEDVRSHIVAQNMRPFFEFLKAIGVFIDEDEMVPYVLARKYESLGLKPGDAFIAGYAEWVGAEYLISENRSDIVDHPELFSFKVCTAAQFLKKHS